MSLTIWPGKIKLFPVRESLVSEIPAVDWKPAKLFLQCTRIANHPSPLPFRDRDTFGF
jgi:hypothetical protein